VDNEARTGFGDLVRPRDRNITSVPSNVGFEDITSYDYSIAGLGLSDEATHSACIGADSI
jgi:hypothetical protein